MNLKTFIIGSVFCFSAVQVVAQTTITLQPSSLEGKDASVWSNGPDNNYENDPSNSAYTWTNNGALGIKRSFMEFDFSSIPSDVVVTSARLSLYYNPTAPNEAFGVHNGTNDLFIKRVISSWDESTLTWANQPSTSDANQVTLPPSTSETQDYLDIDVTDLVVDMNNEGNYGFLIRMVDEINYYKNVLLASSDHLDSSIHPKLEITYVEGPVSCQVIKPNSVKGKDASVWSNGPDNNYENAPSNSAYTWTNSGALGIKRSFMEFDFSSIPSNVIITNARLSLYYNPTAPNEAFGVHNGTNDLFIERVSSSWEESTLTWNNQPPTSTTNQVTLLPSSSETQDYLNIDVTDLVIDMNNEGNYGFLIRMADEINYYKNVLLASSDHPDSSLHPEIEICWIIDNTISVNEMKSNDLDLKVYPNPSNG